MESTLILTTSRGLGTIFTDRLDQFLGAAIKDRFGEPGREQSEGITEFGNPNTVSQPVHQSQLPGGQPLNNVGRFGVPTSVLIAGGVALVTLAVLVIRR